MPIPSRLLAAAAAGAFAAAALAGPPPALAQTRSQASDAPSPPAAKDEPARFVDQRADRLLHRMADYLRAQPHFTVEAELLFDEVLPSGQKLQLTGTAGIALRRPAGLYAEQASDLGERRFWYDGKRVTLLDPDTGFYAVADTAPTMDEMLAELVKQLGFSPPLADFLGSDPYGTLRHAVRFGVYVGPSLLDGVRVHHLAFVQETIDWQIWIEDGPTWVPRKFLITYKAVPGEPQYTAVLKAWNFGLPIAPAQFEPDLPARLARLCTAKRLSPRAAGSAATARARRRISPSRTSAAG
jgi:hypothetical protein